MLKKIIIKQKKVWILLGLVLLLSSCALASKPNMDEQAEDGKYHYRNKELGFNLTLPEEFIYYQFQRKTTSDFTDLEFFVPTSDLDYPQEVPGYAKPVVVRVFKKNFWSEMQEENKKLWQVMEEKKDKVYAIQFWLRIPKDWTEKWTNDLEQKVIQGFEIN